MLNSPLFLRSLVIYAVCIAAALILGCVVANMDDQMSFVIGIGLLALLLVPMLLKWNHFWLIASWNTSAVLFFAPGPAKLPVMMAMVFISLGISVMQHALNRKMGFVAAPSIAMPLFALLAVVLVTAKLTGGLGMSILHSTEVGGKRYVFLFGGIAGYFALAANRISVQKAPFYVGAFFLCGATSIITDLAHFFPPSALYYMLLLFPPTNWWEGNSEQFVAGTQQIGRLGGVAAGSIAIVSWLLAMYGIRGIFNLRKFWRLPLFLAAIVGCLAGGYRITFVTFCLLFACVFVLEGLPKSKFLPLIASGGLLVMVGILPFTDKLPLSMQRSMAVVPFIKLDSIARAQAEDTSEWREKLWLKVLPQVPKYLLLGKGLSINASQLAEVTTFTTASIDAEGAILASDFHSGPLSVVIPFGFAGAVTFLWLLYAGGRGLYFNYRYGEPELQRLNTFLLATFIARTVLFIFVFGSFFSDLIQFTGILGLSVAINGGVRKPVPVPRQRPAREMPLTRFPAHAMR